MTNETVPSEVLAKGEGDHLLTCRDCGMVFLYTREEQRYHAAQGWENTPIRCQACREIVKRRNLIREIVQAVGQRIDRAVVDLHQLIELKGRHHLVALIEQFRAQQVHTDPLAADGHAEPPYLRFFQLVRDTLTPEEDAVVFLQPLEMLAAAPPPRPLKKEAAQKARMEAAHTIAQQLGEENPLAIQQIIRLLRVLSAEHMQALLAHTDAVERAGGMWLEKAQRRRTPGGVFFVLAKELLTPEQRAEVFPPKQERKPAGKKRPPSVSSTQPPAAPHDASTATSDPVSLALPSAPSKGVAAVKLTLIGRPGRVFEKAGYVLTSMTGKPAPALPKGLPTPPTAPTVYTIYMTLKHWKSVAEALQDADDVLIAEGYPTYDPELEGMAVFVTGVTTKKLQAAKRQQQATV